MPGVFSLRETANRIYMATESAQLCPLQSPRHTAQAANIHPCKHQQQRNQFAFGRKQALASKLGATVTEERASRTVNSFRDLEPAKERLHEVGADAPTVLATPRHTLFGSPATLSARFELHDQELGQGGNAIVRKATCKISGKEYACKSIKKTLEGSQWSDVKKQGHLDALRKETEVLRRLRGSLNVATVEDVYEDEQELHIIMELCNGGELVHRIGNKHYSERTVASYMRAVLRTVAQCHSHHILHRDIKPGNFLLLNDDEMAPLKAIDFGLATPYKPEELPRSDLGLEGTPWYMAPEVLSSQVEPASDVWSVGVMAHQLLCGRFPFDDKSNPLRPSVTKIWQSILCDKVNFGRSHWDDISDSAKDFVGKLLEKDPAKRLTAKQALRHPWVQGDAAERLTGKPLSLNVVQRIQRFGQHSMLKRTILEHIAEDMLQHAKQGSEEGSCPITSQAQPILTGPSDPALQYLFEAAHFGDADSVSRHQVTCTLQAMGYRLDARETEALMDLVDSQHTGIVSRVQLAASQIDWQLVQQRNTPAWLEAARRTFSELDTDGDGVWSCDEILDCLHLKLAPSEVAAELQEAMREAHKRDESIHEGIDFNAFLTMLRTSSADSLDQYDDRIGSSAEKLSLLLDKSCRAGECYPDTGSNPEVY